MDLATAHTSLSVLLARYFDACDRADFDTVVDILAGATVVAGPIHSDDPAVIRQAYAASHPAPEPDGRRVSKNHVTNIAVEESDGVWTLHAYYFRLEPGDGAARVTKSGRLVQRLRREADRWRVLRHEVHSDF